MTLCWQTAGKGRSMLICPFVLARFLGDGDEGNDVGQLGLRFGHLS